MVTASFCCGLFANMQSAQPEDFENLPLDLPTHISHQNGATYQRTSLHNLRHYSCERVSITKLTEIATYCTSLCAVREEQSTSIGARRCPTPVQGGGRHVRLRFVQQIVAKWTSWTASISKMALHNLFWHLSVTKYNHKCGLQAKKRFIPQAQTF